MKRNRQKIKTAKTKRNEILKAEKKAEIKIMYNRSKTINFIILLY